MAGPLFHFSERARKIQCLQIKQSIERVPATAIGSLFNAIVASVTLSLHRIDPLVVVWTALTVVVTAVRLWHFRKSEAIGYFHLDPEREERFLSVIALISGASWGMMIVLAGAIATPAQFCLLALLSGGVQGAAFMTYGILPRAGVCFLAPLVVGSIIGWMVHPAVAAVPATLMVVSFAVLMGRTMVANEKIFVAKVQGEEALRASAETVQLLLNDYEEQSADWLWTVDARGMIESPSVRFAGASGRAVEVLDGMRLVDLFDAGPERDMLVERMSGRYPFRDLTVQLTVGGARHWWTLSAQPHAEGGMRGVASDVTAQQRAEARVRYMAHYDGLTNLANRFLFNETLAQSLKHLRPGQEIAVLCLDLDHFKSVNDTLGHPVGDRLLCEVARRIEAAVHRDDLVARLGGDEFALLIHDVRDAKDVERRAARIIAAVKEPVIIDDAHVLTTASIGIATGVWGDDGATEIMKRADLALYSAKTKGRSCFMHFESGMDDVARERRELEMDLRLALSRGELELYYQPLMNIEKGTISCCEALLRWHHPERGLVMPDVFIGLAEETGLIVDLGEWVIRRAAQEAAKWPDHVRVAVNLSPIQMRSATLISTVVSAIARAGIAPSRLELEITESVFMQDNAVNLAILHKLKDLGVRIALDDFGTGYSSLNYLRSFPFDKIKIDRCFVEGINERKDCQTIVRAVTGIAGSLGMSTTAEGVERPDQLNRLRSEGCTEIQGYYFSRPRPARELSELYARERLSVAPDIERPPRQRIAAA